MDAFNTTKVKREEVDELVGQIIDTFEDFLEEKNIDIENPEKIQAEIHGSALGDVCILYGTDYDKLQSAIEETLIKWGLAEPRD